MQTLVVLLVLRIFPTPSSLMKSAEQLPEGQRPLFFGVGNGTKSCRNMREYLEIARRIFGGGTALLTGQLVLNF